MVAVSFLVDQAVMAVISGVLCVLFVLQLLVQRQSKYDQRKLSERLRIEDWRAVRKKPNQNDAVIPNEKRLSTTVTIPSTMSPVRKPVVFGFIQWTTHRIGLLASILACIRCIDPYGVHGIFSNTAAAFLYWNIHSLIYTFGLVVFLYPVHLVRFVALHRRTKPLEIIGVGLSMLAFVFSNVISGLYAIYGEKGWLRSIVNFWFALSLLCVVLVYNHYMHRLSHAMNKLIGFHQNMQNQLKVTTGGGSDNTAQLSTLIPKTSATNLTLSDAATTNQLQPVCELSPITPQGDTLHRSESTPNQPFLSVPPAQAPQPSPSGRYSPFVFSPAHSDEDSTQEVSMDNTNPTMAEKARGNADPHSVSGVPPSPSIGAGGTSLSKQFAQKYIDLMKKMRLLQILCNVALLIAVTVVAIIGSTAVTRYNESRELPAPDKYSDAALITVTAYLQLFVLSIAVWYSYLPISSLCKRDLDDTPSPNGSSH